MFGIGNIVCTNVSHLPAILSADDIQALFIHAMPNSGGSVVKVMLASLLNNMLWTPSGLTHLLRRPMILFFTCMAAACIRQNMHHLA